MRNSNVKVIRIVGNVQFIAVKFGMSDICVPHC